MTKNNVDKTLIYLIIFFLFFKIVFLLTSPDLIDPEECIRGAVANTLLSSEPSLDWIYLQQDPYSGGSFSRAVFLSSFYYVFGDSIIVIKSYTVLMSFLILISAYFFVKRFFNKNAAVLTSLFFILSPYIFSVLSFISWGSYDDSMLFSLLISFLFFKIFFQDSNPYSSSNNLNFIILGIISGFGSWNQYAVGVIVLSCLIFWFVFDKLFFLRKKFFLYAGSFIIGFLPWIIYNLRYGFAGLNYGHISEGFFSEKLFRFLILDNFKLFFLDYLPNSFSFRDSFLFSGFIMNWIYYSFFIISLILLLYINRKNLVSFFKIVFTEKLNFKTSSYKVFFIIFYILIFYFVFFFAGLGITSDPGWHAYIHLIFVYPFIFIILALALNYIFGKISLPFKISILFILLVLLFVSNIDFSFQSPSVFDVESSCLNGLAVNAGLNYYLYFNSEKSPDDFCSSFDGEYLSECAIGIGWSYSYSYVVENDLSICNDVCESEIFSSAPCNSSINYFKNSCLQGLKYGIDFVNGIQ